MKGLFILQRRFAPIGNAIAYNMKKNGGMEEAVGYVYFRSSFDYLRKQKDSTFKQLWLDEDIHKTFKNEKLDFAWLTEFEKAYGIPTLWPYITVDRIVYSGQHIREYPHDTPLYTFEEMLRIFQVKAKAIIQIFDEEKPDFILISVVGAIGSRLIYEIAKKRNIQIFVLDGTRIRDDVIFSEEWDTKTWADRIFDETMHGRRKPGKQKEAEIFLRDFQSKPKPYFKEFTPEKLGFHLDKSLAKISPRSFLRALSWLIKMTACYYRNPFRDDYEEIKPLHHLSDTFRRKLRSLIGYQKYFELPREENFVFFPLHFEPEIAISLYAPYVPDQAQLIKKIAMALPVGHFLYVKEHPQMIGYRPRRYYRDLKKIPNVRIIHPAVASYGLIQNAKLITTITSTVGWEAMLFQKPVISFGKVFYNKLSNIVYCENLNTLPWLIKERLEQFRFDETELIHYLSALLEDSVEVPLVHIWTYEFENDKKLNTMLAPVAALIKSKLRKRAGEHGLDAA